LLVVVWETTTNNATKATVQMMDREAPETCWGTHKRQVINLWNCWILLVDLFESYNDARTCERQKHSNSPPYGHLWSLNILPSGFFPNFVDNLLFSDPYISYSFFTANL
jgi:hypothetical protein